MCWLEKSHKTEGRSWKQGIDIEFKEFSATRAELPALDAGDIDMNRFSRRHLNQLQRSAKKDSADCWPDPSFLPDGSVQEAPVG